MNGLWFGLERLRERVANAIAGMDTAVSQLGCVDLGGLNVPFRRHAVDARGAAGEEGMKTAAMSHYNDPGTGASPYSDKTPIPDDVPPVQEIGATSAPLKSAAFFIGAKCKDFNGAR